MGVCIGCPFGDTRNTGCSFADVSVTLDDSGLPKLEAIVESLVKFSYESHL